MGTFHARVAEAVERRAARGTASSVAGLTLLLTGVALVVAVRVLGRELLACGRAAWWALRAVPALARVLIGGAVVFWVLRDPWYALPLTVAFVGLLLWPRLKPASFRARIAGPARAAQIRRAWPRLAEACGLAVKARPGWDNRPRTKPAKLRRSTSVADGATTRLKIGIMPGQTPDDLAASVDKLAAATGSVHGLVSPAGPSAVTVDLVAVDALAATRIAVMPAEPSAVALPRTVTVGVAQSGEAWRLTTAAHTLTAGCTGAGKGSVMWSLIAGLAPAIHGGCVRISGIDLKGGMELGTGRPLFARLATNPEDAVTLLEDLAALMTARAASLAGTMRAHTATVGDPAWVVVVDEMAVLTAYLPDRDLKTRAVRALSLLLTQGRAVGVTVWAFLQDPSKDVLTVRDLFTQRVCLRMTEPTQATMVLGELARHNAPAHQIDPNLPGTGYAASENRTLQRVRAAYVTDDQIRYLAANFSTPVETVLDPTPATVEDGPTVPADSQGTSGTRVRKPRAPRAPRVPRGRRSAAGAVS